MKHLIRCMLSLIILVLSGTLAARQDYAVKSDIQAILDDHSEEINKKIKKIYNGARMHGVWQFDWLPNYYVKYGLARIKGLEHIQACIEKYNLTSLTTPDKRLYHIPGRPTNLSDRNYAIVVKAVEKTDEEMPLTLDELKQLCTIIRKADYIDMTSTNYMRLKNGKICLIDTEGIFDRSRHLDGFLRMVATWHDFNTDYTEQALKYLLKQLRKALKDRPDRIPFALKHIAIAIKRQDEPISWDFVSYIDDYVNECEEWYEDQ